MGDLWLLVASSSMKGEAMTSPRQCVQLYFNFIAQSRADGLTWAEIERQLDLKGCTISRGYLRVLYEKEEKRVSSPSQIQVLRWLYQNYDDISMLVEKKVPWDLIIAMVPPNEEMEAVPWRLSDVIALFRHVKEVMPSSDGDLLKKPGPLSKAAPSKGLKMLFQVSGTKNRDTKAESPPRRRIDAWDPPLER